MNIPTDNNEFGWQLIADRHCEDFDEFSESIRGWDFELHQLTSGRSSIELFQFGRPEFMLTRFYFEQSYNQTGEAPPGSLTFGLCEEKVDQVATPDGSVQQDGMLCFPTKHELSAVNQPGFRGYSLSISEELFNVVAQSSEIGGVNVTAKTAQSVLHCDSAIMTNLRSSLRKVSQELPQITNNTGSAEIIQNLEFDLTRQLLMAMTRSRPADRLKLTGTQWRSYRRALDYVEANTHKPITVLELAQASGVGVRTLEHAFQGYCGVTPKYFLKTRRLVAVQRELTRSSPENTLIGDIAARWGFWHMSQFAQDYRRFFDELPSETLRKKA